MKKSLIILICLGLIGCISMGHLDKIRTQNRQNLIKLNIGMSKQEVLDIMGYDSATDNMMGQKFTINNPYRSEILQGKDKTVEVIYYVTDRKTQSDYGFTIADDELTPLIFDNGKLIGWGWSFLQDNVQKYELRMR